MNENKMKKNKKKKILLFTLAALGLIAVGIAVYAWFFYKRQVETLTWIKTPIRLEIGSGNNHDIAYLDMGSIDAETEGNAVDYVFCVYGEPIDIYSLQLSYTTNIPFYYDIYRANLFKNNNSNSDDKEVNFTYNENGTEQTEKFTYKSTSTPIISAEPLSKMDETQIKAHQSHNLSYGDDKGENPVDSNKVQSNAEPLYWLASEKGLNVLNPINKGTTDTGNGYFLDYFVIHVSWDKDTVINNKETDMVYLTVSR